MMFTAQSWAFHRWQKTDLYVKECNQHGYTHTTLPFQLYFCAYQLKAMYKLIHTYLCTQIHFLHMWVWSHAGGYDDVPGTKPQIRRNKSFVQGHDTFCLACLVCERDTISHQQHTMQMSSPISGSQNYQCSRSAAPWAPFGSSSGQSSRWELTRAPPPFMVVPLTFTTSTGLAITVPNTPAMKLALFDRRIC